MSVEQSSQPANFELRQLLTSKEPQKINQELDRLAEAVLDKHDILLSNLRIAADYGNLLSRGEAWKEGGKVDYISQAMKTDIEKMLHLDKAFKAELSEGRWIEVNARLAILAELKVLGREDLSEARRLQHEHPKLRVGIQKEQLKAILAMEAMHSPELPSGMGKSNPCVLMAAVGRALLTKETVHLMVANPQLQERDGERLAKFATEVGLETGLLKYGQEQEQQQKELQKLLLARQALDYTYFTNTEERDLRQEQLDAKIIGLTTKIQIKMAGQAQEALKCTEALPGKALRGKPQLIVGTDKDFVFSKLSGADFSGASCIMDEELPFRRASPFVIENLSDQTTEKYLADWALAGITQKICNQLEQSGYMEQDKTDGRWLLTEEGLQLWDENIIRALSHPETAFQPGFLAGLQTKIQTIVAEQRGVANNVNTTSWLTDCLRKELVRIGASSLTDQVETLQPLDSGDWRQTGLSKDFLNERLRREFDYLYLDWLKAKDIKKGVHYVKDVGDLSLRDKDTGHALAGHRYEGMISLILEAREKVCSFQPASWGIESKSSMHYFLKNAYGQGKVALTSATLSDLEKEIGALLHSAVVAIEPWIGEPLEIPPFALTENRQEAIVNLRTILIREHRKGRPVCLVCDDDEELKLLEQEFRPLFKGDLKLVLTNTTLAEEKDIMAGAGQMDAMEFVNPKEGRGVHVKTSDDVEALGGLKLIVWGALENEAVLRQVLARTKRVGRKGDVSWLVYKSGGRVSLTEMPVVIANKNLQQDIAKLTAKQYDLAGSLIKAIYEQHHDQDSQQWLRGYNQDATMAIVKGMIYDELSQRLSLAGQPLVTQHYLSSELGNLVNWPDFLKQINDNSKAISYQHGLVDVNSFDKVINEQARRMQDFLTSSWSEVITLSQGPELPQQREETIVGLQSMPNVMFNLVRETFASGRVQYRIGVMRFINEGGQRKMDERRDYLVPLPQGETELTNFSPGRLLLLKTIRALGGGIKFNPQDFLIDLQALERGWALLPPQNQSPAKQVNALTLTRNAYVAMRAEDIALRLRDAKAIYEEKNFGTTLKAKYVRQK